MKLFSQPGDRKTFAWGAILFLLLILVFLARTLVPESGNALRGIDIRGQYFIWFRYVSTALGNGHLPLWNPNQLSGYPFFSNPQVGLFYPPTWLTVVLPTGIGISLFVALHMWLSGIGMLLFVRYQGANWLGAILAALTWSFSHQVALRALAGHLSIIATITWLPWLLLATEWSVRRRSTFSAVLLGLIFCLAILAGHPPVLFFVAVGWFLFAVYLGFTTRRWTTVIRQMSVAIVIGLGASMVQLLPTLEFALVSSRGDQSDIAFSSSLSLPLYQLASLVNPELFGSPFAVLGYWGADLYWEVTYYLGVLGILGLLLALRRPTALVYYYLSLVVVAVLLAVGEISPVFLAVHRLVPPFRMFRAPARAMFLALFAICGLLAEAVTVWDKIPYSRRRGAVRRFAPLFLALALLILLASFGIAAWQFSTQRQEDVANWLRGQGLGLLATLVLFSAGSIALIAYFRIDPKRVRFRNNLAFVIVLLALLDALIFGAKYIDQFDMGPDPFWVDAKSQIGNTQQRILPWELRPFALENDATMVGLSSVRGYNPMQLSRYAELIALADDLDSAIYDLLGVEYVISRSRIEGTIAHNPMLELLDHSGSSWIYRRKGTLPIARLVPQIEVVANGSRAIERILSSSFDPQRNVILDQSPPCQIEDEPGPGGESVEIISRETDRWLLRTNSSIPSILVLSENDYPGWRVSIDGAPAVPLIAYTTLRAVCVPAGEHTVEWTFRPSSLYIGIGSTLISLTVVGIIAAREFRPTKQDKGKLTKR